VPRAPRRLRHTDIAGTSIELAPTRVVAGGDGLAHGPDGRVVLVEGGLPGERVLADIVEVHKSWSRAVTREVVEASPDRRKPPCPFVAQGCGGCSWQHVDPVAQRRLKRQIVADALRRQGGLRDVTDDDARILDGPDLPARDYRTTVRAAVLGGRAGFRKAASHEVLPVDACLVAHPMLAELFDEGWFEGCDEVTMRVGERTGERLVVADPTAADLWVPDDVITIGADELAAGKRAWHHEEAAGRRWRISATSFFQTRADGADALVAAATTAVRRWASTASTMADLCTGVGLFAGGIASATAKRDWQIIAVEQNRSAVADAKHNLADLNAKVVRCSVDAWRPAPVEVVVADPSRAGLGARAVGAIEASGAGLVVLVSCDPASLGRDAGLLTSAGYRFVRTSLVDLFPHTWHLETVSVFVRADSAAADVDAADGADTEPIEPPA
jgi:23S rRNA (uracil1939-C5)-methyltransferase